MLGHKNRLNKKLVFKLEETSKLSLSDISYLKLFKLLDTLLISEKEDLIEVLYLKAKLAVILNDLDFFTESKFKKFEINEGFTGFQIWYSFFLILRNKVDLAEKILNSIEQLLNYNDFLHYTDFNLVLLRLYFEKSEYNKIESVFEKISVYLDFLPEQADFTKLGLYQLMILTYQSQGKLKEAKLLLRNLLSKNSNISEPYQYSKLLNLKGTFYRISGDYEKAKICFTISLGICKFLNDRVGEASRITSIGHVYYFMGDYKNALSNFNNSKEINEKNKNFLGLARVKYSIGNVLEKLGRSEEAITEYQSSLSLFKNSKNQVGVLKVYNGLGKLNLLKGNENEANSYFNKALIMAKKLNLQNDEASLYNNIGFLHLKRGDFSTSTEYLFRALEIYRRTKNNYSLQTTVLNIVENYRMLGKFKDGLEFAKNNIKENYTEKEFIAFMKIKISTILFDLGKLKEANTYANEALELFEQTNSPINIGISKRILGRISYIMGDSNFALKLLDENIELLSNHKLLGEIYQFSIIDKIEINLSLKKFDKINEWRTDLLRQLKEKNIEISKILKANLSFLNFYNDFSLLKLNYGDFKEFVKSVDDNEFFELKIKCLILDIGYNIQKNNWKETLQLIEYGLSISKEKHMITLQIDTALLTGLLETNRYNFDDARNSCEEILSKIEENSLDIYKSKVESVLSQINKSESNIKSIYGMIRSKKKEISKETLLIPKENILKYLEDSLKSIRNN